MAEGSHGQQGQPSYREGDNLKEVQYKCGIRAKTYLVELPCISEHKNTSVLKKHKNIGTNETPNLI